MTFGEKLQLLRKQEGMSQEQLAAKLAVSRQAISKWELDSSLPDTENVIRLSELFHVTTDYLLKEHAEAVSEKPVETDRPVAKRLLLLGIGCVAFSCISFFAVWLLEKIYPAPIVYYNSETKLWKVGLENFIWVHGLENFMGMLGVVLAVGLVLIGYKQIQKLFQIVIKKLAK